MTVSPLFGTLSADMKYSALLDSAFAFHRKNELSDSCENLDSKKLPCASVDSAAIGGNYGVGHQMIDGHVGVRRRCAHPS